MNLLRNVIRSNTYIVHVKPNGALPLLHHRHHFSTGTEEEPKSAMPTPPNRGGLVYGRLSGIGKYTMRTDIIDLLDGCNISPQDVRAEYTLNWNPLCMIVQFHSPSVYDHALRVLRTKQFYKLDRVDRSTWETQPAYQGKTVVLQGIPVNAQPEDIERLLSDCEINCSSIKMFNSRRTTQEPTRVALVEFPSEIEAMNAVLKKSKGFCLNNQILMRVLQ